MAIDLITPPSDIVFARNPVIWKLRAAQTSGGDSYDATGVRADLEILITDRFATGETMTVEYTDPDGTTETVVFTASDPYTAIDEIPDNSWPGTDGDYWNTVAAIIATHPRLAPFFTVAAVTILGDLKIRIQAIEVFNWTLVVTNDAGFTVTDTAAAADATPDNYKVRLEVFFENTYKAGDYTLAAQLEGTPAATTGYLYFDISTVLAAQCRAARMEPLVPMYGIDVPVMADNLRRYYIRFTEEYDNPVVTQPWTYSDVKYAIDGGVSQMIFAESDVLAAMDVDDALFTWMPDGRTIGLNQPEYLNWFNFQHTDPVIPILEVKWYKVTDGTLGGTLYFYGTASQYFTDYETAIIPIMPSLLGLDAIDDAYKFTVQVGWDDGGIPGFAFIALSQVRTYFLDRDYQRSERYVQYLNSFGCPECWRCTGQYDKKLKVDRSLAERPLLPGYNELATDRFQFSRGFDHALTYRTGYISRGEAEVLQELLIAGDLYDVATDGYVPLQITSNDFAVTDTNQDLHAYVFACTPRLDSKNYSKKKVTIAGNGAWQEVDGSNWVDAFLVPWGLP
jgi:hypothetical protein